MAQRTTPKKPKDTGDETTSPYNQVDKDAISRNLLERRLSTVLGLALDARLGYILQGEGETQGVSLVNPDLEAAAFNEERATQIAAMYQKVGGKPVLDRIRAAHLANREAVIEQEHAHWTTISEFPDAFDEPPMLVRQSLGRIDQALQTIRKAQADLPEELRGPDAIVGTTEDEVAAARARREVADQSDPESEALEAAAMEERRKADQAEQEKLRAEREAAEALDGDVHKREAARHAKAAKKAAASTGGEKE